MSAVTKLNLEVSQGADYETAITVVDDDDTVKNLTGYTARGQMRKWYTSSTYTEFGINIIPASGIIEISLDKSVTKDLAAGRYVYDVFTYDSANTATAVVEGIITIKPSATQL